MGTPDLTTVSPYLKSQCIKTDAFGPSLDGMVQGWVRLSLSDSGFLSGIFLNASRHLSGLSQQEQGAQFSQLATWYKLPCVRAVNDAINLRSEGMLFSDSVIAQVMILALDEITTGDMAMARNHVRGAASMVVLNGGPQTLGLGGFLEMILEKYADQVGVRLDQGASHGSGIPFEDDVRS
ncbi:hypothetical protein G647_07378 [Cladophialophora carrionii CBS 160.54]|uniref:Uncharacterized protein n=1 Tax=Cladophialophora carrionii CBS 160.54 TaxID=1279043 RepID=V9D2D3_9EURO|nr:uncharacterized protein G647_07378 [Cladophialophora carrionii CBS 160.54]ETI21035.1 hypothetical protein G647_07378 [Cladophialophora carrionii CBS 160.54]